MFDDYTDLGEQGGRKTENGRKEQKLIWQELPGDGSVKHAVRRSGSRYADKKSGGSFPGGGKSGFGSRRNGGRRRLPLAGLLVVVAVFAVWAAAVVLLPMKKENSEEQGIVENPANVSGEEQGAAGDPAGEGNADPGAAGKETDGNDAAAEAPAEEGIGENLIDTGILDSPYAALMDAETGAFLASKRGDEKIFPASMTKMLTVLTAIEHIPNLDETIYMSEDYYQRLYDEDASRAGFEPGEPARIRDLLYGALLPSGAECCIELARQAAGTESAFVDLMNQKAAELGLTQTNFVNCTGLHDPEQFSTCAEMAKIVRAAIQNETFFDVFTTHHYSVGPSDIHPEGFTFWSTLFKSTVDEIVTGGEIIGGKTGFTEEAGRCLASLARIYDHLYILVTAGWSSDPEDEMYHINDAFRAYNALGSALES